MKKHPEQKTLAGNLQKLLDEAKEPLTFKEILTILSGKGRALLMMLLSIPFCQPLQIPGISTPFGLIIAFLGIRMAFGQHIWFPKKVMEKKISPETLKKISSKLLYLFGKIKKWVHPRLEEICSHPAMNITNGLVIATLGLFLALPLPIPLSNIVAAWAIFLMALGILENDGLFVILGYVITFAILCFFIVILFQIKWFFQ